MPSSKARTASFRTRAARGRAGARMLGIHSDDAVQIVRHVQEGFRFRQLARFQQTTQLPWEKIARFVGIPQRTLTRRQGEDRLQPDESDRVLRAARVFELAVDLFEGDAAAARQWLLTPQPGLGGQVPLEFASTDVGGREVENLIGRLEHGVVA